MTKEIEIVDSGITYTIEYSDEVISGEEEVGRESGVYHKIHAIWINLIYASGKEDIIVIYSDTTEKEHVIDISDKSEINVDEFYRFLLENLHK